MKKNYLIICFFLIIKGSSQEIPKVDQSLFKINFLGPGLVYEYGLSKKTTFYSEVSLGFLFNYNSNLGTSTAFNLNINEQFRYYYNFEKRNLKNKRTNNNSANYFALIASNSFKPFAGKSLERFSLINSFVIGPAWGFQRTYKGNFNLDLNLGLGARIAQNNNRPITGFFNFTLGWIIFDK